MFICATVKESASHRPIRANKLPLALIALLGSLLLWLHWAILAKFNWLTTDMDQVFMWYGVQEMREGRFHMPRYFGQDYGSMLEAWISVPFTFISYNKLLPLAAYFLLLVPYGLLAFFANRGRWLWNLVLVTSFVGLMSVEYIAIGAMPRDMGSGIAITALALPFIHGRRWFHYFFIGFFCLLGWSFNANAALFGAVITVWVLLKNREAWVKAGGFVALGYAASFGIHAAVDWFLRLHPELVVQHRWPLNWEPMLFVSGIQNLSRHWAHLVPYVHDYGGLYLIGLALMVLFGFMRRNFAAAIASIALITLLLLTLGLDKIHDAVPSVYFSFERMYMALPPAFLFLALMLKPSWRVIVVIATLAAASMVSERMNIEEKILELRDPDKAPGLTIMDLEQMQWRCEDLAEYWNETQAQAMFFGPGDQLGDWVLARGCACVTDIELTVRPEYERKTWELRTLDQATYSSFLWISPSLNDSLLNSLNVPFTQIDSVEGYGRVYSIHGENLNPMEIYTRAGFETVDY